MTTLMEDERQMLLRLIDMRCAAIIGRRSGVEFGLLRALRRKLEGGHLHVHAHFLVFPNELVLVERGLIVVTRLL